MTEAPSALVEVFGGIFKKVSSLAVTQIVNVYDLAVLLLLKKIIDLV